MGTAKAGKSIKIGDHVRVLDSTQRESGKVQAIVGSEAQVAISCLTAYHEEWINVDRLLAVCSACDGFGGVYLEGDCKRCTGTGKAALAVAAQPNPGSGKE